MRKQAYDWLQAEVNSLREHLQGKINSLAYAEATEFLEWQRRPDLAGVRDKGNLAMLPEAERESWKKLWADVGKLQKQAAGMVKEPIRLSGTVSAKERQPHHDVKLLAGRTYVIDLESTAFDTFLVVLDAKGTKLAENDDIEPIFNLNSRLTFTPKTGGVYRLVASAFENSGVGPYTLTIREFVK